jgi:hypothetical protein
MKLKKSAAGRALIILYYSFFLAVDAFFTIFIVIKTGSILAGLGIGFALGIGIGILGGEIEFRENRKVRYGMQFAERTKGEASEIFEYVNHLSGLKIFHFFGLMA